MDVTKNPICKHSTLNQSAGATRAPVWGADEAVSFNETSPEPVEETENAENIESTDKSGNAITAAEIYIYISTDEADEATNLEDIASDKDNSTAEKVATKASKTDTKLKKFNYVQ